MNLESFLTKNGTFSTLLQFSYDLRWVRLWDITRFGSEKTLVCVCACVYKTSTRLRCQTQKKALLIKDQSQLSRPILPNTRWVFFSSPQSLTFLTFRISPFFEDFFFDVHNWRLIYFFLFKYDVDCRAFGFYTSLQQILFAMSSRKSSNCLSMV